MRISIGTLGTRGDVQPYLALARELMARGHEVQLAGPAQFADFAAGLQVSYASLPGEFLALLDTPEGKAAVGEGQGFSAGFKLLKRVRPLMRHLLDAEWDAAEAFRPELLVFHPKSIAAPHMAERLGVPAILASPLPGFTPTAAFPTPMLPMANLGPFNKISHQLAMRGGEMLFGKELGRWRQERLGLPGRKAAHGPVATIYAYSPSVVPVPADWDETVLVSGYWFLDDGGDWTPSPDLEAFLSEGDKPIYVGFGSMPGVDPSALARTVIDGLARAGKRGLLATGGGALDAEEVPAHVRVIPGAPHHRLFGLVSAALHHGGAGTTGASLRAGLPTIICPFFGDQPFWGRRVAQLGAGPPPLDRKSLDAATLATAFLATDDAQMRSRARALGAAIAAETGVATAADYIERVTRSG